MLISDETSRFVRALVNETEDNMISLRNGLSSFIKHNDELHHKSIKMSNIMRVFAEKETSGLKSCLLATADGLCEMERYRKEMLDRINLKSREPLGMYASICDNVLDDLKVREQSIKKEFDKQLALDRLQVRDITTKNKLSQRIELSGANHEAMTSTVALAETVERFEMKKISDLKCALQELVYSQMLYSAKSLEILSDIMGLINSTDFDLDLDEVCEKVKPK